MTNRPHSPPFAVLSALAAILAGAGCQTIESSRLVGAVEDTSGATEEAGEHRLFVEVVRPEPAWRQQEADLREQWLTTDYDADRKRIFRAFEMPDTYTFGVDEFKQDTAQADRTGPYLLLQLRERQFVTVTKQHQVQTRSMLSGPRSEQRDVPVFSYWKWEPKRTTRGGASVWIRAEEFDDEPGRWHALEGVMDDQGRLTVSLVPWIDAGLLRARKAPLVLQVTCDALRGPLTVQVMPDALFHLQQLHAAPAADAGSADQPVQP